MLEVPESREGMEGGAEGAVEFPDHDLVDPPPGHVGKEPRPRRAAQEVSSGRGIDVLGCLPATGGDVRAEGLELDLRVLVFVAGRNAGIEGESARATLGRTAHAIDSRTWTTASTHARQR